MSKEKKNMMTPRLRFPEFRDAGEWTFKNGDEVFNQISNKNHNSDLPVLAITQEYGAIPRDEINYTVIATDKSVESYKVVEVSDFIISLRSFQGGIEYSNYKGICSPAYIILRKKIDIEDHFFRHYFKNELFIQDLNKNIEGIRDGKMVTYKQFSELLLPIPSKPEQQKIAATLTTLDDLITAQAEKIKALQTHKKGLMQQLFPVEGERVPRVRFPEFEGDGEWEEKSFDQLYSFFVTNSFSRDDLNYTKGTIKNIHYGDIHTKFNTLFDIRKETVPYVNNSNSINKIKPESYCIEGDMIFADASEDLIDIGKSIEIIFLNNEKLLSGLHTLLARQKEPKLIIGFGGHLFRSDGIRNQIKKEAQGAKVLGISASRLSKIKVSYPKEKREQQKIAATLTTLDDLITYQNQKLEALKTHKKGIMQQLFPNPNEIVA